MKNIQMVLDKIFRLLHFLLLLRLLLHFLLLLVLLRLLLRLLLLLLVDFYLTASKHVGLVGVADRLLLKKYFNFLAIVFVVTTGVKKNLPVMGLFAFIFLYIFFYIYFFQNNDASSSTFSL